MHRLFLLLSLGLTACSTLQTQGLQTRVDRTWMSEKEVRLRLWSSVITPNSGMEAALRQAAQNWADEIGCPQWRLTKESRGYEPTNLGHREWLDATVDCPMEGNKKNLQH